LAADEIFVSPTHRVVSDQTPEDEHNIKNTEKQKHEKEKSKSKKKSKSIKKSSNIVPISLAVDNLLSFEWSNELSSNPTALKVESVPDFSTGNVKNEKIKKVKPPSGLFWLPLLHNKQFDILYSAVFGKNNANVSLHFKVSNLCTDGSTISVSLNLKDSSEIKEILR
jgi:hypothetical protein